MRPAAHAAKFIDLALSPESAMARHVFDDGL
jgi:hypothetical protein